MESNNVYREAFKLGYEQGLQKRAGLGKLIGSLISDTGRYGGRVLGAAGRFVADTGRYASDTARFGGRLLGSTGKFVWKHPVVGLAGLGAGSYQVSKAMGNEEPWLTKKKRNPVVKYLDEAFVSGENANRNRWVAGGVATTALLAYLLSQMQNRRRY